ncbi:hypothetical protein Sango_3046200 [Sesamum angolense]|uniref:Reverse transcriptase zinc-binding domain-containing protein n=1 Tax=Sesamum angolense TaxID=2727404 RepID=A0AAE1VZ69_9LAMI|nr:hypothetical protein Sango_3046200 [Sesamum angolense]
MIKAASWNVRGLNGLDHQRAIDHLVRVNKISFIGLIETRVSQVNVQRVRRNLLLNWSWFDDYAGPEGRIWVAWDPLEVTLMRSWMIVKFTQQSSDTSVSMTDFRNCVRDSGLVQLPFTGCPFTWHNCSEGPRSLWKRLDRMLANTNWMDTWPSSSYISALPSTSDHSPLILTGVDRGEEQAIFRFDNYLAHLPGFLKSVEEIWKHRITGTTMYETVCKLKLLKAVFRQQKRLKGNLTDNVRQAKNFLDQAQTLFTTYKEDIFLDLVKNCRRVYSVAVKLEISMLQQRAKLRWLKHGDQSSKIFFRKINTTRVKQRIFQITKVDGELLTAQQDVNQEFISYFQNLFGGPSLHRRIDLEFLRHKLKHTITTAEASLLVTPVTLSEVKEAFFDIDVESAPGPDGYTSAFYRYAWPVIGQAMFQGVGEFFRTGKLLKQLNTTLISLIPKVSLPRFRIKEAVDFQYHWKCKDIGLKINPAKSQIIFSRAVQTERQQILDYLGFQEGSLPVKYLGIPLTSSRLTIADCRPLIDKVDARLAGWNNQTLSYAGRLQLIKSVLSTLHMYWASAFILPKGVLKTLEKKMRQFLWQGSAGSRNAKVAWEWISIKRGRRPWIVELEKDAQIATLLQQGVTYKIGDGSSFSLWQDAWHERGPLCLMFPRGPEVTGLPLSSHLSSVIQRHQWCWPASTDTSIISITSQLPPIHSSAADSISWRSSSGKFTFQEAVSIVQPTTPRVFWYVLLQGNFKIPRHGFILWMAILEKLSTMDKPWVPRTENGCVLCGGLFDETHDHLFFKCSYSQRCLSILRRKIKFQWPFLAWQTGLIWASKRWRGTHLINAAFRATLAALVYHLWGERNNRKFSATSALADYVASRVLDDIRMRILAAECPLVYNLQICIEFGIWQGR